MWIDCATRFVTSAPGSPVDLICREVARGRWPGLCLLLARRADPKWTAQVSGRDHRRQTLPQMGPHGQAVINQLLARAADLQFCEHAPLDFAFRIASRPGMLLCDFCYQAAQMLAEDIRCAAGQQEVPARPRS
jgi:hypothetical protein